MTFARRQLYFISLLLTLCMFFAPFMQELHAESIFTKLKNKASNFISTTVEKYTSRDFWVDKAASTIATKVLAKPVKLATAALGIALGTAVGGPIGATIGAYVGSKIATNACKIIGTPLVKSVINDKIDNGTDLSIKSIYRICKNTDMPSLACDTTGAVVGDILGSAIGGIAGAAVMACVGGGTILPIIGTITFATLGSKYGEKLGKWLGEKIGERAFNKTYKAFTGIDRTEDHSADKNTIVATIDDIRNVNKEEVARTTTSEIVGDVIGSALGTIAGATLTAVTGFGTLSTVFGTIDFASIGENLGSDLGTKLGKKIGNTFFDKSKDLISKAGGNKSEEKNDNQKQSNNLLSDSSAAYEAYKIAYSNYAKVLADPNSSLEEKLQRQKEYNACYEMYRMMIEQHR